MISIEQGAAPIETVTDRDYIAKHKELLLMAAHYIDRTRVWVRDFQRDATEMGYDLEHTEALMLLTEAQQRELTPRLARQIQWREEDTTENIEKVWAAHAPWNQEERI